MQPQDLIDLCTERQQLHQREEEWRERFKASFQYALIEHKRGDHRGRVGYIEGLGVSWNGLVQVTVRTLRLDRKEALASDGWSYRSWRLEDIELLTPIQHWVKP